MRDIFRVALLVVAIVTLPGTAHAAPEDVANDVARLVMSPYCPGVTLHDCPSDNAVEMREQIEGWARDGMSKDEILTRLEDEYGPAILATPPRGGRRVWVWLLPFTALVGGLFIATLMVKRGSRRRSGADKRDVSSHDRARIENELRRLRGET